VTGDEKKEKTGIFVWNFYIGVLFCCKDLSRLRISPRRRRKIARWGFGINLAVCDGKAIDFNFSIKGVRLWRKETAREAI
jgi:hypothetical protein